MENHPIEGLMNTAMNSIKDMVDVNTIIGEPIETSNNIVIIPISKVTFGFAAGGSEFNGETINEYNKKKEEEMIQYRLPFGGGSGAGVNINPIAFLVIQGSGVKLLPVSHCSAVDKLLDYMPDLIEKTNQVLNKYMQNNKEEKNREYQEKRRKENELKKEMKTEVKKISKTHPKRPDDVMYEFEYDETPMQDSIDDILNSDDEDDY